VLGVWVTVLIVGVTLMVVLWAGTTFLQGYFYTEVSTDVFWQAPAAAAALTLFYGLWCLFYFNDAESGRGWLPSMPLLFSVVEHKYKEPPKAIEVVTKRDTKNKVLYTRKTEATLGRTTYEYQHVKTGGNVRWPRDVIAIFIKEGNEEIRYDLAEGGEGANRRFVDPDGWAVVEFETGPAGPPERSSFWRWLINVLLNLFHFGLWFACLWLLLRFQWGHAFMLAIPMWLMMTLVVVPVMLERTEQAVQQRGSQRQSAAAVTALFCRTDL
jgi:hypothetical protein